MAVFGIQADGSLASGPQIITHFGALGPNAGRQEAPHPHMALPDSTGKYVLVNDLGLDVTIVYAFDTGAGKNDRGEPHRGPRRSRSQVHLVHGTPTAKSFTSINELGNIFNVYLWDGNGNLSPLQQSVSTLPAGFWGPAAGEIQVDAVNKFLYGSNRGSDNIVVCSIDPATYQLTVMNWVHTQGETPRHFNFDPSGNFIHVLNQGTGNIVTFKVDKSTGGLTPAGLYAATPAPACIQFQY